MSGAGFVKAIFFWLAMLMIGFVFVGSYAFGGTAVPLIVVFSGMWIVLTLWWAWKIGNIDD